MDKKASFVVVVSGQYHAMSDVTGTPVLKNYTEAFTLPSQEAALSNICKHLLSPRLKKTHSDFIRFRTHELISIKLQNYTPNTAVLQMMIDDMNILELYDFCILQKLLIDPYVHASKMDIYKLRQLVQTAYNKKRQAEKSARSDKNAPEKAAGDQLREMNDLPPVADGVELNTNEQRVHKGVQTAQPAAGVVTGEGRIGPEADEPLPPEEPDNGPDSESLRE